MFQHTVNLTVPGLTAQQVYDFMINPTSDRYSSWWPGEHLEFEIVKRGDASHLGDTVFVDEHLGPNHRIRFRGLVVTAERPRKIAWQMVKAGVRLPAFLELELHDAPEGLLLKHELRLGWPGIAGKATDWTIKLYFNKAFQAAVEAHCKQEWPMLVEYLGQ